jgi:hypothetical protein
MVTSGSRAWTESRRFVAGPIVAALLLSVSILLAPSAIAAGGAAGAVVRIHLTATDSPGGWRGRFVISTASGRVIDRGSATEHRYTNGAVWLITLRLTGGRGDLVVKVSGASLGTLKWTIVSGTRAYAGLHGHGREVDREQRGIVLVRMLGVPPG